MKGLAVAIAISSIFISACTAKQLYNSAKGSQEAKCREHVGSELEQCLQEIYNKSYEDYEKERQQVLKDGVEQ